MGFARIKISATTIALALLLQGQRAGAQESPQADPLAMQEIGTELSTSEKSGFDQLRNSMDPGSQAALFDFLDHMTIGPRGAFVSTLLDQKPEQRSNILGFLKRLNPEQRSQIADMITQGSVDDEPGDRQWTKFFAYVGSVSPDEAISKIFVSFTPLGSPVTVREQGLLMIWHDTDHDCTAPGPHDPSCGWSFSLPPPAVTGGDFARPTPWQVQLYMSDKAGLPYTNLEIAQEFKSFGVTLSGSQRHPFMRRNIASQQLGPDGGTLHLGRPQIRPLHR